MSGVLNPQSPRDRGGPYGDRLHAIQIGVPDTSSPNFAAEARRQSLLVARSPHAEEDQSFVDSISESLCD
ncbi:MAG: antitoxin MazE family protein [Chloroflexi bacterium]|nr:antitoxin MazE family protein [Chloroflexota bacterium]